MKITKLTFLLVFVFFYCSFNSHSQKLAKELSPLVEILKGIESQKKVSFTYTHSNIENVSIFPPNIKWNLSKTLTYLEEQTNLKFSELTKNHILISLKKERPTFCGNLIDFNLNKSINGAHIVVLNTSIKTSSNEMGYFKLPTLPPNEIVEISHISYPTIYINSSDFIRQQQCLTIQLAEKIEALNEIIIRNYLTNGISIKTDNSFIITPENFGILPGLIEPDVLHQIQALPGISSVNETISDINIRGGTNDQNLLMWDGIKMYHSGHFFGLISAFNPYLTDSVEVIKNGTNAQYNDGVSGTISIKPVNEIKEKSFGGGGFNLLSVDAYAQIPVSEKFAIQASGRRATTDWLKTFTFEQYFNRAFQNSKISTFNISPGDNEYTKTDSDFNFYDFSFKVLYDISKKHKIRFSLLNVANNLFYNETYKNENITDSKTSSLKQDNLAFGMQAINQWNSNFKTDFQAYYTKYNIDAANYNLHTDQRLIQRNEVLETGVKLNTNYTFLKNIQLLNGYHYYELGITNSDDVNLPTYIRTIKRVLRNHSFYTNFKYVSNNETTFINAGLRLNYIEKFGAFLLEPRLQLYQKLNAYFSFKLAGEFKSQNATQIIDLQEDFLGVAKKRWILANNESIPIIKSKQVSAGINFKKKGFFIDVDAFYKFVDGITTSNQGFLNQNQFIKTSGSYTVQGVEFLINRKIKNLSTWLGYTFNSNNYSFPSLVPSEFPNNLEITHYLNFGSTYSIKSFNFALGLNWRTGKPHTTPIEEEPIIYNGIEKFVNYNSPNSSRLPNYFRADISATYKFNLSKTIESMVGISVLNLFNNKNVLNRYYEINADDTLKTINNTSISTTPNFTFRVSF